MENDRVDRITKYSSFSISLQYHVVMVSTTIEKAFFLIFSLSFFMVSCIPVFGMLQLISKNKEILDSFDEGMQVLETAIRHVERNDSMDLDINIFLLDRLRLSIINDGWTLLVEYFDDKLQLNHSIHTSIYRMHLIDEGIRNQVIINVRLNDGCILIQIMDFDTIKKSPT